MNFKIINPVYWLVGLFILFNVVVLNSIDVLFSQQILSICFITFIPGFLLYSLLNINNVSTLDRILYIFGLSLSFLIFVGFSVNSLSVILRINRPLTLINCMVVFDFYMTILFLMYLISPHNKSLEFKLQKFNRIHFIFYSVPILFPVLSFFGCSLLNNMVTNIPIMILLFAISIYVLFVIILHKELKEFHLELPIYLIAVSLLLMFSLRSSYIIGWDIYQEYKVFLLTNAHQLWNMKFFNDPYNACLSITILPTLFHIITNIDTLYIFKILFQFFFAFVPVIIYSFGIKFSPNIFSFLATFFFMSTGGFFLNMPSLARQEIAFIFFSLLLSMIFNSNLKPSQKNVLFIIYSSSIIVSHYSTTYVLIGLFIFSSILISLYNLYLSKYLHKPTKDFTIKPLLVIYFILFSYLWFGIITSISNNIFGVLEKGLVNISRTDLMTPGTSIYDQIRFMPKSENSLTFLKDDIQEMSKTYLHKYLHYYSSALYSYYNPIIIYPESLPFHIPIYTWKIINFISIFTTKILKLMTISGLIYVIVLFRKKLVSIEYLVFSFGFAIAIVLISTVPVLSLYYPSGRLTQQALLLATIPAVLSLSHLLKIFKVKFENYLLVSILIMYFLFNTSFIGQLIGGTEPQIHLNNSGTFYDEIYLHTSEIFSINWLDSNYLLKTPIFTDISSTEKIKGYSTIIRTFVGVFPSNVYVNSYVYSNYTNTVYGKGIANIRDKRIEYNYPNEFLLNNKNVVYSNGKSRIFR